jgi:crossover junction endodeoxyribonuclease RuvC
VIKTEPAIRILGIDPGTRFTGVGIIDRIGNKLKFVHSETINAVKEELLEQKLTTIFLRISEVIKEFSPIEGAVERVFHSVNPRSSLLLGHARGVAILAMHLQHLRINDYAPNEVKSAITGAGKAGKDQVGSMVQILLNLDRRINLKEDETDALAIAICHANTQSFIQRRIG